jgi:hypothetical protein
MLPNCVFFIDFFEGNGAHRNFRVSLNDFLDDVLRLEQEYIKMNYLNSIISYVMRFGIYCIILKQL